ncbi:MAG: methyltransferase domain-containing protein [Chthoniobacterales bacterium]
MDPSTKNLLYRRPELYELVYPEQDEATPRMCLRMFSRYLGIQPSSVLDIGCGTGRDLNVLSRFCNDCWGIDYLQEKHRLRQKDSSSSYPDPRGHALDSSREDV